jgi:integrase/recombinase XerD
MNRDITPHNKTRIAARQGPQLPAMITGAGERASRAFLEFFFAHIRNTNTRRAYARAVGEFFAWSEARGLELERIEPLVVAAYVEQHQGSKPTIKQHLAAIRMLFDWLVINQVVRFNPAASVRGPKYVTRKGKTPVLSADDMRQLFASIDTGTLIGRRDQALIGVMLYSFARVGAVVTMKVDDYYAIGTRSWLRLHEKGGKLHEVPAHHNAQAYLDAYLDEAGIREGKQGPLFQTFNRTRALSGHAMHVRDVERMVKRRAEAIGINGRVSPHSFRATGITIYLNNGGTLEHAQAIAAHESPRTTKLYDRTSDAITLDEIERIAI